MIILKSKITNLIFLFTELILDIIAPHCRVVTVIIPTQLLIKFVDKNE